jgi:hypothetical protein
MRVRVRQVYFLTSIVSVVVTSTELLDFDTLSYYNCLGGCKSGRWKNNTGEY